MAAIDIAPKTITWRHTDPDLNGAIQAVLAIRGDSRVDPRLAYQKKADGSPMMTTDRVRLMRSLSIATLITIADARVQGLPPAGEMDVALNLGSDVHGRMFDKRGHLYAASTLGRTLQLFGDPGLHTVYDATTNAGDPAAINEAGPARTIGEGEDTALGPVLAGLVIVSAAIGLTLAACYVAQCAAEVIDRKLTRDADTARMALLQAGAIEIVTAHKAREIAEKRTIPYDAGELRVIDGVFATQLQIAKRDGTPLPNPFAGAVKSVERVADQAAAGVGLGVVAAGAIGAALFFGMGDGATRGIRSTDGTTT
jgi:hypothetical protein